MENDLKHYEIAYLLHPSIAEEEVLGHVGKITALIEDVKGMINQSESPKKRKLAYEIEKERNAYFGWTQFLLAPEKISDLDKKLKLEGKKSVIRYLLVEQERVEAPRLHNVRKSGRTLERTGETVAGAEEQHGEEEKLDLEALDKKLEEILGK